jgi:hypothetical protein
VKARKPFLYNKPSDTKTLYKKLPEEEFTKVLISGNISVVVVRNVMRGPNHLYETDDGIVTVLNTANPEEPPKWETRYYPKSCLPPKNWREAMEILGID